MFVVYRIDHVVRLRNFDTLAGARRSASCMNRNAGVKMYAAASVAEYIALRDKTRGATKKVRNLVTGEMIEIDSDTPRSCDPSSDLYWSM